MGAGPGLKGALLSREFSLLCDCPGDLVPMGPGCQKEAGKLRILRGTCRGRPPAPGPAPPPGPCCVSTTAKSLSSSDLLSTLSCTTTRDPGSSLKSWAPGCCWPAPGAAILVVGGWRVLALALDH